MSTVSVSTIMERGRVRGFPLIVVNGGGISGEMAYSREATLPGNRTSMAQQLDALEAEDARRADLEAAADVRERTPRPLDFTDPADHEAQAALRMCEDAAEVARRSELPMTRAQAAELLSLQRDILAELRKRA